MRDLVPESLTGLLVGQSHPLLFVTVSGAHLYGFPSEDSDVDLRGIHQLPLTDLVGLRGGIETTTRSWDDNGVEVDLVTHDLGKFARMLLRRNGYVLEQLLSPLIVRSTAVHRELVALAPQLITRHHAQHYLGFARTVRAQFQRTGELKPLLYTHRVLLTGRHLMLTGECVADLPTLAQIHGAPDYLPHLVSAKILGEHRLLQSVQDAPTDEVIQRDIETAIQALVVAAEGTSLPSEPSAAEELHQLVIRTRLGDH